MGVDLLSRGRYADQVALVGAGHAEEQSDLVAFRDDFLDHVEAIRNRAAQERARARESLAFRIRREVVHPAAHAPVVWRQDFAHDLLLFFRALRFLEAQRHRLVALELHGIRLRRRGPRIEARHRQARAGAQRALEKAAACDRHASLLFIVTRDL